jgi:hypothetical protein
MISTGKILMMFLIISTLIIPKALIIPSKILEEVVTALVCIVMLFAEVF